MRVLVYIIPTARPFNRKNLKKFFKSNDYFELVKAPCMDKYVGINDILTETNSIYSALGDSFKRCKESYVITILDTSITASTPEVLEELIRQIVPSCDCNNKCSDESDTECYERSEECSCDSLTDDLTETDDKRSDSCNCHKKCDKKSKFDVAYLADWQDRCDLFEKLKCDKKSLIKWVKTLSPHGVQSLLWSPKGRDIVLGEKKMKNGKFFTPLRSSLSSQLNFNIEEGNLNALTTTPNFFFFDVNLAVTTFDLEKLCACREIREEEEEITPIPFTIFIVLTAIVIAFAWLAYTMWGKHY